ncbi:CoA transferase subunit A [Brevibacillus nitrificans]|uniref:CoA transferase subunit A n=1 Tax=Brevibacillus nitrificans TaxID=651560 RepID=UPI002E213F86|nr:CoA transferase subunit A [Brevibacillus nitrificans]
MEKWISPSRAASMIRTGDTVMVGGFGLVGTPLTMIQKLESTDVHDLTIISNNLGDQNKGLGKLLADGKVKKAIGSYFTGNPDVGAFYHAQRLQVELIPQGSLSEAIRAGGAGIGGFLTKTAVGTALAEGKTIIEMDGEEYLLQKALRADVAIIRAHKADTLGNLTYYKTARNFNPMMATAAKLVIAEVDEIVEAGELDPEQIITPHLFVDYIVRAEVKIGG